MRNPKVTIIWRGLGGELDCVTVEDNGDENISVAICRMLRNQVVSAGDTITVEAK